MGFSARGSGPTVILLDWYRTLSHSLFWEPWMASDDAVLRDTGRALSAMLFEHGEPSSLGGWMRGELDSERVVADVARAAGVDPAFAMRGLMHSCAQMTLASAEILPRVASLRAAGVRVGIATDNMDTFTRWTAPALGLDRLFGPILNSSGLGALKGDPVDASGRHPFFGELLAGLGPGGRVFLVDDGAALAPVAAALGMTFCHVTPGRDSVAWLGALSAELLPESASSVPV